MCSVTIVNLVEAYSRKPRNSVWIVPGNMLEFSKDENCELWAHIDDYLLEIGICVCEKVVPETAGRTATKIAEKFSRTGIEVRVELLCND